MSAIVVETPPACEPLSLSLVKSELKIPQNVTEDDKGLTLKIRAAREWAENGLALSLINKGYRQSLDSFPYFTDSVMSQNAYPPSYYSLPRYSTTQWNYSQMMKLMRGPLQSVTKISYSDSQTGQIKALFPALFSWEPTTEYTVSEQIEDPNGNLQIVTAVTEGDEDQTSISGTTQPAWSTILGAPTTDGMLTWTCMGPVPDTGDFIYDADSEPPRIFPLAGGNWPSVLYVPNAVQLHFVAGFGNTGDAVPSSILVMMLQLITHWHRNREPVTSGTVSKVPFHIESLLWSNRNYDFGPTRG